LLVIDNSFIVKLLRWIYRCCWEPATWGAANWRQRFTCQLV